jgi:hypothetical protein
MNKDDWRDVIDYGATALKGALRESLGITGTLPGVSHDLQPGALEYVSDILGDGKMTGGAGIAASLSEVAEAIQEVANAINNRPVDGDSNG